MRAALAALEHRGPDGSGIAVVPDTPVVFGHRRLSIIDLSESANQPMAKELDGHTHTMVFNGEIYNYVHLRSELEALGVHFHTKGDTEVLLAGCAIWGPEETARRARGMFAFAYVDGRTQTFWLGRDRFGEKPLYYFVAGGTVGFASELKALRCLPNVPTELDRRTIAQMLSYQAASAPATVYLGVEQVPAGAFMTFPVSDRVDASQLRTVRYWDVAEEARTAAASPFRGSLADATDALDRLLGSSVAASMVSDVPIGAFLSGGIDSSVIVALMKRASSGPVKTFTIGFEEDEFSEATEARRVADHLGVDHTELTVTSADALAIVPKLADLYDEPFGDSSQIPTHLVSALARTQVTVALSGDGGDELFGGYTRYDIANRVRDRVQRIPAPLRAVAARTAARIPVDQWNRAARLPGARQALRGSTRLGERVHRTAPIVRARNDSDFYQGFVTSWDGGVVLGVPPAPAHRLPNAATFREQLMLLDTMAYLPDDILVKVDRAAMAASLETRVPLLDPDVFRFAWSLPMQYRMHDGVGKVVLRETLSRYVPKTLWDRPKMGFGVPVGAWLRGPLRGWGEDLLSAEVLRRQGILDVALVRRAWDEHQRGAADNSAKLWNVLVLQAWLQRWN
jgi:asparagine synthase (glutamine-hydrolysing)